MVRVERANGLTLISFKVSAIDEQNFATVADELDEVARFPKPQSVVIDLTGVRQVDELGLTVLQSLQESVREVGGTAVLSGPTESIDQAIHDTRLAREIEQRDAARRPPRWTQW